MSKFYFLKTWDVETTFSGDQTFLLATSFFKIHGALLLAIIELKSKKTMIGWNTCMFTLDFKGRLIALYFVANCVSKWRKLHHVQEVNRWIRMTRDWSRFYFLRPIFVEKNFFVNFFTVLKGNELKLSYFHSIILRVY